MIEELICWAVTTKYDEDAPERTRAPRWLRVVGWTVLFLGAGGAAWYFAV
jgi:hypothetical protein